MFVRIYIFTYLHIYTAMDFSAFNAESFFLLILFIGCVG